MPVLFFVFILVPLIELAVIIKVGSLIGVFPTIALLILSAMVGIVLVRKEGLSTLLKARQRTAAGQAPEIEALESLIIALSGCLMILPGFITDIIGLCGLIPPIRHLMIRYFKKRINIRVSGQTFTGQRVDDPLHPGPPENPHIIEGEFTRNKNPEKSKKKE